MTSSTYIIQQMPFCARLQQVPVPVVLHECVKVILVGILVYVPAGPVDVGGHVSVAMEWSIVHVVGLVIAATEATIHTLQENRKGKNKTDEGKTLVLILQFTSVVEFWREAPPVINYLVSETSPGTEV